MLAYGIHDLQEAGILPGLHNLAWDVSAVLPPSGVPATILKGVFNFSPATTWLEAVTWVLYVVPTTIAFLWVVRDTRPAPPPASTAPSPDARPDTAPSA